MFLYSWTTSLGICTDEPAETLTCEWSEYACTGYNMSLDEKTVLEYMLLRNYQENGLIGRGFLLRLPFVALKQIEEDKWEFKIEQNEKPKFISFIQNGIISKIMMYIEDLAILAESFMSQQNFYDIVYRSEDLGDIIGSFFRKVNTILDDEIYRIMNCATPSQIKLDYDLKKILTKHLNSNVKEIRRILGQIGEFGNSNHPLFKRFKHAGMPLFLGTIRNSSPGFFEGFKFCNIVSTGGDPLKDVLPIPYSKQVLEGYEIMVGLLITQTQK
jgi:hypothetical protein